MRTAKTHVYLRLQLLLQRRSRYRERTPSRGSFDMFVVCVVLAARLCLSVPHLVSLCIHRIRLQAPVAGYMHHQLCRTYTPSCKATHKYLQLTVIASIQRLLCEEDDPICNYIVGSRPTCNDAKDCGGRSGSKTDKCRCE
jgi:hypothetical protein